MIPGSSLATLVIAALLSIGHVSATEVAVGVYNFPPVASISADGESEGLLGDLLNALERSQDRFTFRTVHTSPRRRHMDFDAGLYDVIFFESPDWGWAERDVEVTPAVLADEDLYVALRKPGRDSTFFDDIEQRSIVAMAGYHYGFTGYETDASVLEQNFDIEFSDSHSRNLRLIKADRPSVAEVAIVSHSYLQRHLAQHPEDWDALLISDRPDQRYQLHIIARRNGPMGADQIMDLLAPLIENGQYRLLVEKWGLQLPAGFLTRFNKP